MNTGIKEFCDIDWKSLSEEIHKNAISKGFWNENLSNEHYLMLVITEISEIVEAERKEKWANNTIEIFKKVSEKEFYGDFNMYFELHIKDTVEDELADAMIRLLDLGATIPGIFYDYTQHNIIMNITESCYKVIQMIVFSCPIETRIVSSLNYLFDFAILNNIDILWHIKQKMRYNSTREFMHGKKF